MFDVERDEEIRIVGPLFTCPNVPTACVTFRLAPQPIQRLEAVFHVKGNANFQGSGSWNGNNSVTSTDRRLLFSEYHVRLIILIELASFGKTPKASHPAGRSSRDS